MNLEQSSAAPGLAPIPWAQPTLWGNESRYVSDAIASTWISGGTYLDRFEKELSRFCGGRFAAAVANGTAAIHAAYLAIGIVPGDEVIVPGFAFMAAANVALHLHARPIFAEVDPETWCLRAEDVERCLSPRTRLIVPVHTYGNVCRMDAILELAASRGIAVLEDAAESFASRYRGSVSGTLGTMGTFSFQATKTITTGEGGMVVTADRALHDRLCLYRSHGMSCRRYWHDVAGHNFRLTNFQAAMGCAQLEKLDEIIDQRRRVHRQYVRHLANLPGLFLQVFPPEVDPVLWAMAVKLEDEAYPQGRDQVIAQLAERQIETRNGFYAPSQMGLYGAPPLPVCEDISRHVISLPTFPTLTDEQIEYVCRRLAALRK